MSDTLKQRLDALALDVWDDDSPAAQAAAEKIADLAVELDGQYVHADAEGDVPTPAQGVALARFLRPAFRADRIGDRYASVSRGGAGLSENYLHVRLADGYEGGIDREGRVST